MLSKDLPTYQFIFESLSMPMPVYGSFTCSTKKLIFSDSISLALIVLQILQSPSRHTNCRVQTYCLKKWRRQIFLLRLVDNCYDVVGWNKIPLKWGWLTPLCCWEGLVIFGHELSVICYTVSAQIEQRCSNFHLGFFGAVAFKFGESAVIIKMLL